MNTSESEAENLYSYTITPPQLKIVNIPTPKQSPRKRDSSKVDLQDNGGKVETPRKKNILKQDLAKAFGMPSEDHHVEGPKD